MPSMTGRRRRIEMIPIILKVLISIGAVSLIGALLIGFWAL